MTIVLCGVWRFSGSICLGGYPCVLGVFGRWCSLHTGRGVLCTNSLAIRFEIVLPLYTLCLLTYSPLSFARPARF